MIFLKSLKFSIQIKQDLTLLDETTLLISQILPLNIIVSSSIPHSSKLGRNATLTISKFSEYRMDIDNLHSPERYFFFLSLISDQKLVVNTPKMISDFPKTKEHSKSLLIPAKTISVSLYPDVDKIVKEIIQGGRIREVKSYQNSNSTSKPMLIYEISGNRFCRNIDREHKRNNVYYVYDVTANCMYQKCHDPDCQNYRSNNIIAGSNS